MMRFTDLILQLFHAQQTRWNHTLLDFTDGWHQAWISIAILLIDFATIQSRELGARRVKTVHALQGASRIVDRTFDDVIGEIAFKIESALKLTLVCWLRSSSIRACNPAELWLQTSYLSRHCGISDFFKRLRQNFPQQKVSTIFTLRASWKNSREWILFVWRRQQQLARLLRKKAKQKWKERKIRQFSLFSSEWKWILKFRWRLSTGC